MDLCEVHGKMLLMMTFARLFARFHLFDMLIISYPFICPFNHIHFSILSIYLSQLIKMLFAIFVGLIIFVGHQFVNSESAFDTLHFHPAAKSHYSGPELYEKRWIQCMQELKDLKQKSNSEDSNESYETMEVENDVEEEEDSYEKNFPPNYRPAYNYKRLHISDIIYPLKLHKVPSYPRKVYVQKHSPTSSYERNQRYGQEYGEKNEHLAPKYGMNDRRNYVEKQRVTPKNDGYGKERPKQEYNYSAQEKQMTKMEKYGPKEEKEVYEIEERNHSGKNGYKQNEIYGQQMRNNSNGYGHKEEKDGYEQNNQHSEEYQKEESKEEQNSDEEEHYSKEEDDEEYIGENPNKSDEPYSSPEEENEESKEGYENDEGEKKGEYATKSGEEEEEEKSYYSHEEPEIDHRHQSAHPPPTPHQQNFAPSQQNIVPPPPLPSDQIASFSPHQQQQMPPENQPTAPQPSPLNQEALGPAQEQPQIQEQQPMPNNQKPAPQLPQIPLPSVPINETAPINNQSSAAIEMNPIICRMEPIAICSARAGCQHQIGLIRRDCMLEGTDMIFDAATQDCKSIIAVPECQKDVFCIGKPLGWTPVGGQCTKVAYMCGVSTNEQQNDKLLCQNDSVVNPADPAVCTTRAMAGC